MRSTIEDGKQGVNSKIDNIILEFRDRVFKLKATSEADDFNFTQEMIFKVKNSCKDLRRQMIKAATKYYLGAAKGYDYQEAKTMVKFGPNNAQKIKDYIAYQI